MTDDTRLSRIKARCNERGWLWGNFHEAITDLAIASRVIKFLASGDINPEYNEKIFEFAEALLSRYEPAPVVVIPCTHLNGTCDGMCSFHIMESIDQFCIMEWAINADYPSIKPGDDCPGPAPDGKEWVMVLRKKVEDHEQK